MVDARREADEANKKVESLQGEVDLTYEKYGNLDEPSDSKP